MSNEESFREELKKMLRKASLGEIRPVKDRQERQTEIENDVKNTVARVTDLRYNKKKLEAQLAQLQASVDKKRNLLEILGEKSITLQENISKTKKKISEREALIYPVLSFYESMGLRFEITESFQSGFESDVKVFLSKIPAQPERVFMVHFLHSPTELKVLGTDPKELLAEISDIATDVNGKLVNGKINFLLFLYEIRMSIVTNLSKP